MSTTSDTDKRKQQQIAQILQMLDQEHAEWHKAAVRMAIMYSAIALAIGIMLGCAIFA